MKIKLCIDPGHGMSNRTPGAYDPGAVAAKVSEADVVLLWALAGKYIANHEFKESLEVWLTRDDAEDVTPVGSRADRAVARGCTHFLSLHCNSGPPFIATGTETFVRAGREVTRGFHNTVQNSALKALGLRNRGIKSERQSQHKSLAVLHGLKNSALLELGFISHPLDRGRMLERDRRIAFWREFYTQLLRTS